MTTANLKLDTETLDKVETRFIQAMLGDVEVPASAQEIMRRVLKDNGRLTNVPASGGEPSVGDPTEDELEEFLDSLK